MAEFFSGPEDEEYLWAVTLDNSNKEYVFDPVDPSDVAEDDDEDDPPVKPNHKLQVKSAILHPTAKDGEVVMLELETEGYNEKKICTPFVAMKGGLAPQQLVDIMISDAGKIKLVRGEGPITLLGAHYVGFGDRSYGGNDVDDAESSEDDEADMEEQEAAAEVKVDKAGDKDKSGKKKTPKKSPQKKAEIVEAEAKEDEAEDKAKVGKKTPKKSKAEKESPMKEQKEMEISPTKKISPGKEKNKKRKASGEGEEEVKKKKSGGD